MNKEKYIKGMQRDMMLAISRGADYDDVWHDIEVECDRKHTQAKDDSRERAWSYENRKKRNR